MKPQLRKITETKNHCSDDIMILWTKSCPKLVYFWAFLFGEAINFLEFQGFFVVVVVVLASKIILRNTSRNIV